MIFIGIGGGTVWLQNWKYGESLTLTVFSLTPNLRDRASVTVWKISLTETLFLTVLRMANVLVYFLIYQMDG